MTPEPRIPDDVMKAAEEQGHPFYVYGDKEFNKKMNDAATCLFLLGYKHAIKRLRSEESRAFQEKRAVYDIDVMIDWLEGKRE